MNKHTLIALLSGMLVLGVSTAFAEEPQPSDQEVLKAWGQTQMAVEPISQPLTPERTRGVTPLTDEELEQITGAGLARFDFGLGSAALNRVAGFFLGQAVVFLPPVCVPPGPSGPVPIPFPNPGIC